MKRDVIAVVEAAYADAPTDAAWRANLLEAAKPFDAGLGLILARYSVTARALTATAVHGTVAPGFLRAFAASATKVTPALARTLVAGETSGKSASMFGADSLRRFSSFIEPYDVADCIGIYGLVDAPTSYGLYVPLPATRTLDRRTVRQNRALGVHLGAGYRALRAGPIEAWFEPDGRVVDAVGPARAARDELRRRVRAIDAARTRAGRRDVDHALATWKGLVAGRWSLVERFERDGRRYLVARKNPPFLGRTLKLSPREAQIAKLVAMGQSQKFAAYSLGLSMATISHHLAAALLKLRIRSRADLMTLHAELFGAD